MPPSRQNSPWIRRPSRRVVFRDVIRRRCHGAVSPDEEIRRDVRGGAQAEIRFKSARHRSAGQRLVVAILPKTEMPLPHHRGAIPLRLEQRRDGHLPFRDQRLFWPPRDIGAERITPREQPVARGMTQRPGRMSIGEPHPFPGQSVDMGRRDFRFRVVATGIAIAHVIREQDEDVRFIGRLGRIGSVQRGQRREQQGGQEGESRFHVKKVTL